MEFHVFSDHSPVPLGHCFWTTTLCGRYLGALQFGGVPISGGEQVHGGGLPFGHATSGVIYLCPTNTEFCGADSYGDGGLLPDGIFELLMSAPLLTGM